MFRQYLFLAIFLLSSAPAPADWVRRTAGIMGTEITVELYDTDDKRAEHAAQSVLDEMRRIDELMSPQIETSELYRLNRLAYSQDVTVSDELFALLERSIGVSGMTGGAFDITFASIGFYYDYRTGRRPSKAELERSLPLVNYQNLALDADRSSVRYSKSGVRIDLGGIAKGHAVDRCIQLIRRMGIDNALVTAGGDSRVIGDRWGRPWNIGIRDPRDRGKLVAVIPLKDVAVSTSGDYERYFDKDGTRYHHIIDPQSGDSARELRSVTVIGPDATTTDALSTSIFVLGLKSGLELANNLPGIDAVLVDQSGRMHYTDNLVSPVDPAARSKASVKNIAAADTSAD